MNDNPFHPDTGQATADMINAFLKWKLPETVASDSCVTRPGSGRTGTNLLTLGETCQMIQQVVCPIIARHTAPTQPPAPLAGGTEAEVQASPELPDCQPVLLRKYRRAMQALHAIALLGGVEANVADIVREARQECIDMGDSSEEADAEGFTNPTIKQLESEVTRLSRIVLERAAPAEVADGCKEGRPVSPAPGEREAELQQVIQDAVYHHEDLFGRIPCIQRLRRDILAALTPLLDRREGELAKPLGHATSSGPVPTVTIEEVPKSFDAGMKECARGEATEMTDRDFANAELQNRMSHALALLECEPELAALRTLVAAKDAEIVALKEAAKYRDETAQFIGKENADLRTQLTTANSHMDKLREHRNELDAACHELEGKLRESEAAQSALVNSVKFLCSVIRNNQGWSSAVQDHYDYVTRPPSASETEHD